MRVLGIDPGTVRVGVGIVETSSNSYKLIHYDVLKLSSSEAMCLRLGKIYKYIKSKILEYNVDAVAIEDVFVAVNPRSALKLGQGRGAAIAAAVERGVSVFEYTPSQIKKAVSCSGSADKEQVSKMVGILLGVRDIKPHDASDAVAVSICHLNTLPSRRFNYDSYAKGKTC